MTDSKGIPGGLVRRYVSLCVCVCVCVCVCLRGSELDYWDLNCLWFS